MAQIFKIMVLTKFHFPTSVVNIRTKRSSWN